MIETSQNKIFEKTSKALGDDVFQELRNRTYCIVGCGGIGANFAEMLARSGACKINLIDADKVEESNLNRVFCFNQSDCGKFKVEVVRKKLKKINPDIQGQDMKFHFREIPKDCDSKKAKRKIQIVRDLVCDSDIIGIFCDNNKSRISLEELCKDNGKDHISAAIRIDPDSWNCKMFLECGWGLKTPKEKEDAEGYPNSASLAPIIMECTSVAFSMMLANLNMPKGKSNFYRYTKTYEGFIPKDEEINGVNINGKEVSSATQ